MSWAECLLNVTLVAFVIYAAIRFLLLWIVPHRLIALLDINEHCPRSRSDETAPNSSAGGIEPKLRLIRSR